MNYLEADGGDDDSRPSEDYNTKKVRFEDGFDVVAMNMVVDIDPSLSMAMLWKDKLSRCRLNRVCYRIYGI